MNESTPQIEQASGNNTYRYAARERWQGFALLWSIRIPLSSAVISGVAMWFLVTLVGPQVKPDDVMVWHGVLAMLSFWIALSLAGLGLYLFFAIRGTLQSKRAVIVVEDSGLRSTDWRLREEFLPWENIRELRMFKYGLTSLSEAARGRRGKVISDAGEVLINPSIERQEALINEIISRAHLTETSKDWLEIRYHVPGQNLPVSDTLPGHWIICLAGLFIPIFGIAFGVYAIRRPEADWRKTGKYTLVAGSAVGLLYLYLLRFTF